MLRGVTCLCLLLAGLTGFGVAQDKQGKPADLETKGEKYQSAATIAFGEKLGLSFPTLTGLGVRIEQARQDADPVGLANAAHELAIAEKVSGKQADLTAEALLKEAVQLAEIRKKASELKAVSMLAADDTTKKKLGELAGEAEKAEAERVAKAKSGEAPRGIFRELVVYNNTDHHLHIYVNGRYVGHVDEFEHAHFRIHTHGETILDARGGGHRFHRHVHGDYGRYSWRLFE